MKFYLLLALVAVAFARSHMPLAPLASHPAREAPGQWAVTSDIPVNLRQTYSVTIGLFRRNMDVVRKRLEAVSDPAHDLYGAHMTKEELFQLVSPTAGAMQAVGNWLHAEGVTSASVSAMNDAITFTLTAKRIEEMFGVKFAVYAKGREVAARALGQVSLPKNLHDIVEVVVGFRGFPIESGVKRLKVTGQDNVTPQTLYKEYSFPATLPAPQANNAQAFFQAQGQYVDPSDLSGFGKRYFGSTAGWVIKTYVGKNSGGEPGIESSLDSQYIISTARGATTGTNVETDCYSYPNFDFCADLMNFGSDVINGAKNSSAPQPKVISMSYGWQGLPNICVGPDVDRLNQDFMTFGTLGITMLLASGDDGSGQYSRGGYNKGKLNPSWPASSPYVLAVGSTTFVSGNTGEEMAVNEFGSGGGFSFDYNDSSTFSYQTAAISAYFSSGVPMPQGVQYPKGGRGTPDVSTLGWNFNVEDGGSITQVGGTSASSPSFAGIVTLLNQERLKAGKTMGFINPFLYSNTDCFTDITKGTNAISPSKIGWECAKGWDPVTGLGTPIVSKLLAAVQLLNERDFARQKRV